MDQNRKCELEACGCEAEEGERFCSPACERSAGDEEQCDCGHPECE